MSEKDKKEISQIIDRFEEYYPLDKYEGKQHLADYTKECDIVSIVNIFKKYDFLHSVMQSEYPAEHIRIACAEYYKRGTKLKAIRLVSRYSEMSISKAKKYCDAHFA